MRHSHIVLDLTLSVTGMQERMSVDRPTDLLDAFALGLSDEITRRRTAGESWCLHARSAVLDWPS
jgi:hypothetical protein